MLRSSLCVSDAIPPGRTLCPKCAGAHPDPGAPDAPYVLREQKALTLLREGRRDTEVARALGVSLRTAVRTIGAAQRRTGARTRFQFGYLVGRAER
ncbi:MAG TPA: hypothetical protein VNQ77_14725 [Frankiaceae bacterium]|nr:hypothetical protein [Frankiaceae bacterium]